MVIQHLHNCEFYHFTNDRNIHATTDNCSFQKTWAIRKNFQSNSGLIKHRTWRVYRFRHGQYDARIYPSRLNLCTVSHNTHRYKYFILHSIIQQTCRVKRATCWLMLLRRFSCDIFFNTHHDYNKCFDLCTNA